MHHIATKRIYEPSSPSDGRRVLVDRLWPRGVTKVDAHLDAWMKDLAPSTKLRRWFGHRPERWPEFRRRYIDELRTKPEKLAALRELAESGPVTLLYATKDTLRNKASVLVEVLADHNQSADADAPHPGTERPPAWPHASGGRNER